MNKKFLVGILITTLVATVITGCSNGKNILGSDGRENINSMDINEVERLPESQKETELDKILAARRKFAKENTKVDVGGGTSAISMRDDDIPGQTENRPDFINELDTDFFEFVANYLKTELNIPEPKLGYYINQCMDPRMNRIYEDSDKGVAAGYENENIILMEYETEESDVYSYLVIVRNNKESDWKVIYNGLNYKEQ
ncbi:hypothetical protein [Clostridium sp.]|uniref:hypothetical protein n=1 Tax=Clostridium sp. TaxID=1506 RepID=UPI003F30FF21